MLGLMQDRPLLIGDFLRYAEQFHGGTQVAWRREDGRMDRYGYADAAARARRLASALVKAGVSPGDRIATLAMNGHRHFELYYAVSGIGAVLHTVNPKLFEPQIAYILRHGGASLVCCDPAFVELLARVAPSVASITTVVVLSDEDPAQQSDAVYDVVGYESFLDTGSHHFDWPRLDERTASLLCYTSGTTGDPKGVLYSHRAAVLHAMLAAQNSALGLRATDALLAVAPMFHATAWSLPYVAPMIGAKLILPGPKVDGPVLEELANGEAATFAVGVPTVFRMLLEHLKHSRRSLATLRRIAVGGSAVPAGMAESFREHGCEITQIWGMTELSPLGTAATPTSMVEALPEEQRNQVLSHQGRGLFGVELKIISQSGVEAPWDGTTPGNLWVRGPTVCAGYFERPEPLLDRDGWFPTQDVATIDQYGFIRITDRTKDVIKSGGEWISSVELENIAGGCPGVKFAAVIGVRHPKWEERPLLVIVPELGDQPSKESIRCYLEPKVAKWWMPDDVVFVEEMPMTATGKIWKARLRETYADHLCVGSSSSN